MNNRVGEQYPFFQLAKALSSGAAEKASKWREVLSGMSTGKLKIGNRTPVAGMPVWATPEVVRGGFATGAYAAGGSVRPHETNLAQALSLDIADTGRLRAALNAWYMTEEGLGQLREMANTGCFDAETPEETALLAIALLQESDPAACESILKQITPYLDRLRFFPRPAAQAHGDGVHVGTVGGLREALAAMQPSASIRRQNATLTRWIPLYDRLVDLLCEPVSESWRSRASEWLRSYRNSDSDDMSRRWSRPDGPFQRCRAALERRLASGHLPAGEQNYVDLVIARRTRKYGPGMQRDAYRAEQALQYVDVWWDALSAALLRRISGIPDSAGIADIDTILAPISPQEARPGAVAGTALAPKMVRKVQSVRVASIADLVDGGQITSPEILAAVLPQVTAELHAKGFGTPSERTVYAALYRAFRSRRSLLLLDLQSQVSVEELPWASALLERRTTSQNDEQISRTALRETAALTLTHFPQTQFPNAMVEELMRLSQRAGLNAPFTRELAADIFMGTFSAPFEKAASLTIVRYGTTLYGRYYDLPEVISPGELGGLCEKRAGGRRSHNLSVAWNGMLLEQQLILTSHNLATIFEAVDLSDLNYDAMSRQCFDWICSKLQTPLPDRRAGLQALKNAAYAWRQMIAFLSEMEPSEQQSTWHRLETTTYAEQPARFRRQFDPAMTGLRLALEGGSPDHNGGRVFLGWALDRHPFAQVVSPDENSAFVKG